jgi:hypothetical protein
MLFNYSRIDDTSTKKEKIYPLPHMYVIKDLVPVSETPEIPRIFTNCFVLIAQLLRRI